MAKSKFSLQPYKESKTLTSFQAPKTAAASYQTSPQQMFQRQQATQKIVKGFKGALGNLTANLGGAFPQKPTTKPTSQGDYSQQFVGQGGNIAIGQGSNVNNQPITKSSTSQPISDFTISSQPLAEPVIEPASAPAGASAGSSGGNVGGSGGGTSLGGSSTVGGPLNNEQQSGLDSDLQQLASLNPQLADSIRNKLGYSTNVLSAGETEGTTTPKTTSKFQQGFNQASAVMGPAGGNVSGAQGASLVNQYAPIGGNDVSSAYVQTDPFINGLFQTWQEYINPANQRKSLTETYNQMLKDSGVEAIDTELLNMKNVIEGSEDDLRNEITKAGGFATESQIMALTNARNKQLIKNYNTLLDTRNAKEKYLQTAIGLERDDRNSADQKFESMFSMGTQLVTLNNQMQTNARNQMQWLAEKTGFDGLYDSTGGDPYYTGLIERTLGLPQGGLASSAEQARLTRQQEQSQEALETKKLEAEINKINAELNGVGANVEIKEINGRDSLVTTDKFGNVTIEPITLPTPEATPQQMALSQSQIQQVGDIISDKNMNTSVGPNAFSRFGGWRNILRPGSSNFIANVEQLRSQLNLQSLIDAKAKGATFGALSDQELQVLSNAATKIGSWAVKDKNGKVTGYDARESDFKKELDKIGNFAKLDYILKGGKAEDVGVQERNGKYYSKNSDGSISEIGSVPKKSSTEKTSTTSGMRTDRHNNPTAFTTDIAKVAGLKEGVDYVAGDPFSGGKYKTAKLLGNAIDTTLKVIDKIGFYTTSGAKRWTHTAVAKNVWDNMSKSQKVAVIKKMYQKEGGKTLNKYFG